MLDVAGACEIPAFIRSHGRMWIETNHRDHKTMTLIPFIRSHGRMWIETDKSIKGWADLAQLSSALTGGCGLKQAYDADLAALAGLSSALTGGCGLKQKKLTQVTQELSAFIRSHGRMWIETHILGL